MLPSNFQHLGESTLAGIDARHIGRAANENLFTLEKRVASAGTVDNLGLRGLAKVAAHYENSSVRRLGCLLERMHHMRRGMDTFIASGRMHSWRLSQLFRF